MFSLALEALILTTMDNHMYSFNTDIRLQDEGGSIGNTLTCALAVLFMVYWSRGFKSKLSLATEDFPQFYLKMFRYYMDDGNLGSTAPGGTSPVTSAPQPLSEMSATQSVHSSSSLWTVLPSTKTEMAGCLSLTSRSRWWITGYSTSSTRRMDQEVEEHSERAAMEYQGGDTERVRTQTDVLQIQ